MPFKVVQTIEKGKPVLTAVPHGWEKDGTLFWPKNQADKLIKVEDIYPEDNWIPISCELKRDNISNYDEAQVEISSILYRGVGGHEQNRNQNVEAPASSRSRGNPIELKIETSSQDPLVYEEQAPAALSAGMELILENQRIMLENQKKIMRKLNDFTSKLDSLMARQSDIQCFDTNEYEKFSPIDNLQELEDFENDLKDPEKRNSFFKRFSIICQGKADGLNCAYFLIDMFFTRKFMTKCSWAGGSWYQHTKIPFKVYNNVITLFHNLIHDCDKNFSLMDCHNFFKMILKNAGKRSVSKCVRASCKRTRLSKNIISEIQMTLTQEGEVGYEYEESRDGLEEDLNRKKRRKQSDVETSEGETDAEKELNESDGYIREKK